MTTITTATQLEPQKTKRVPLSVPEKDRHLQGVNACRPSHLPPPPSYPPAQQPATALRTPPLLRLVPGTPPELFAAEGAMDAPLHRQHRRYRLPMRLFLRRQTPLHRQTSCARPNRKCSVAVHPPRGWSVPLLDVVATNPHVLLPLLQRPGLLMMVAVAIQGMLLLETGIMGMGLLLTMRRLVCILAPHGPMVERWGDEEGAERQQRQQKIATTAAARRASRCSPCNRQQWQHNKGKSSRQKDQTQCSGRPRGGRRKH